MLNCIIAALSLQALAAVNYTATISLASSGPVYVNVPAPWIAIVTRASPLAAEVPLDLTCILSPGDGSPLSTDSSFLSSTTAIKTRATIAPGSSTANCTFDPYTYTKAGNMTSSVQVFVTNGGTRGLLGADKPLRATTFSVTEAPPPPPSPTPSPPPSPSPAAPESSPPPPPTSQPPAVQPESPTLAARALSTAPVVCSAVTASENVPTQEDGKFRYARGYGWNVTR